MHNVILRKVKGGSQIRTDEVVGVCEKYPVIGESFKVISDPLVPGALGRIVTTSVVRDIIEQDDGVLILTMNSEYHLSLK